MKKYLSFFIVAVLFLMAALAPSCKDDGAKVYTVKFNSNGGTMFPFQFIEMGDKVVKPAPDPKRNSFAFEGWFTDNNTFSNEWNFDADVVTSDITLFAKWRAVPPTFTVTFNSNGGSDVAPQYVMQGNKAEKPANPTKSGDQFVGWFMDNISFSREWDFDVNIVTANVTLFAKWNRNNVTFNKPVTVSDFLAGFPGGLAVDGIYNTNDAASRWVSLDTNLEHWLEVDLQGAHVISEFKMWRQYANWLPNMVMHQFRLQAWIDGAWVDVVSEDDNSSQFNLTYSKEFDPVTTERVRLYFPPYEPPLNNQVRLFELEVWGYKLD